jgi:hypothetical protein
MKQSVAELADLARLRLAAETYAIGADRRDKNLWREVLADDCLIEGPGFSVTGREANLASIDMLDQMFRATIHRVHQVVATISGDSAEGETYCTADHLLRDSDAVLSWSIRYQDSWKSEAGQWRFVRRILVVDWEEVRPVTVRTSGS